MCESNKKSGEVGEYRQIPKISHLEWLIFEILRYSFDMKEGNIHRFYSDIIYSDKCHEKIIFDKISGFIY